MTIIELLIQGCPETIAVFSLSFVLAGAGLRWRQIIPLGCVAAIIAYFIRISPLPFGFHAIAICVIIASYLVLAMRTSLLRGLYAAVMTLALLILFEYLSHLFIFSFLGVSYEAMQGNPFLWALAGWPQVILLFAAALVIGRLRKGAQRNSEV